MIQSPTAVPEPLVEALRRAKSVLVATHVYPDGDALGSLLAMGEILRSLNKQVFLYSQEPVGHLYDFMPGCQRLETVLPGVAEFDLAMALDCGDQFRLGDAMETLLQIRPFVVVDHHFGHKEFGDHNWVDSERGSTGEMVYDLALALGADISGDAAFNLYTALVSDTGSFKYDSTSAYTFQTAAELVSLGVRPGEVARKLFDNYSVQRLRLLEAVLDTLELHLNDRIAMITVTAAMFERTGATKEDTEDFINYPRALKTVKVAVFIKEIGTGMVSVSMRAKGECDVSGVARSFNGGGHRNAAGFKVANTAVDRVRHQVLQALTAQLEAAGL